MRRRASPGNRAPAVRKRTARRGFYPIVAGETAPPFLLYYLRLTPEEVAWGIVAGSIVIGSVYREANSESKRPARGPQRSR